MTMTEIEEKFTEIEQKIRIIKSMMNNVSHRVADLTKEIKTDINALHYSLRTENN